MADLSRLGQQQFVPGMTPLGLALDDPRVIAAYRAQQITQPFGDFDATSQDVTEPSGYTYAGWRPTGGVQPFRMAVPRPGPLQIPPEAWPGRPENKRWTEQFIEQNRQFIERLRALTEIWYRTGTGAGSDGDRNSPECKKEWEEARDLCRDE